MNPPAESSANATGALLRQIPSVYEILSRPAIVELARQYGRELTLSATRAVLEELRLAIAHGHADAAALEPELIERRIAAEAARAADSSLRQVINATGVILHTNLGRAPLAPAVAERISRTALGYSNLEYNLASGERGQRDVHTAAKLAKLSGAEAAIVVNNNAAAVFLTLHTLARGAEVIVSRGELIEIGDGFRIPEIMAESGATLREVGTTNRTHISDFENAITENTRLLLRVHPSNFRIVGFAARPALEELVALARKSNLPLYEDLGSGCVADLAASGVDEPAVARSLAACVDVISFSGDKLLGGPQAGIIAGKKEIMERIRRNPVFRALRVDKLTIAALEATLGAYVRNALDEIPALRMIRLPLEEIEKRAAAFAARLKPRLPENAEVEILPGFSVIGGGSTPDQQLLTRLVAISSHKSSVQEIEARLRRPEAGPPVIARIEEGRLVLDLRTVFPEEEDSLAAALLSALR
ncbi:MAG: L-seryl-tRNA(Sec) selenium transferase [Candidatus Acidiferrales bacterium]